MRILGSSKNAISQRQKCLRSNSNKRPVASTARAPPGSGGKIKGPHVDKFSSQNEPRKSWWQETSIAAIFRTHCKCCFAVRIRQPTCTCMHFCKQTLSCSPRPMLNWILLFFRLQFLCRHASPFAAGDGNRRGCSSTASVSVRVHSC